MPVAENLAPTARWGLIPKAELHVHVEGTLEPELVFELSRRNSIALPYKDIEDLRAKYSFDDLGSFLDLYYECMAVLITHEDFATLSETYLRRAVAQGVRHVEMFFDPQAHISRGIAIETVIDGLAEGFARVKADSNLTGGLILCFLRDRPVAEALEVLASATSRLSSIIGVGLDSAEVGFPPSLFVDVFAEARRLGLRLVAHAGEEGPASYVREAIELLHVERVDHGNRCLEDETVVLQLRERQIPLTVCPLSNLRLGGVTSLTEHPLRALLSRGLSVSLNSDDPAYFGGYIAENYRAISEALDLTDAEVIALARNSITGSFASATRKQELLEELSAWSV